MMKIDLLQLSTKLGLGFGYSKFKPQFFYDLVFNWEEET